MAEQDGPPVVYPYQAPCNCVGFRNLPFHPRFSALSDIDLDICEIIALSILGGASLTYESINNAFELTKCFLCMTPRQRREYEIWWVLYLWGCTTDAEMQALINQIKGQHTPNEIAATLTGMRLFSWDYADCSDLP